MASRSKAVHKHCGACTGLQATAGGGECGVREGSRARALVRCGAKVHEFPRGGVSEPHDVLGLQVGVDVARTVERGEVLRELQHSACELELKRSRNLVLSIDTSS